MFQIRRFALAVFYHARKTFRQLLMALNALRRLLTKRVFQKKSDSEGFTSDSVHLPVALRPETCNMPTSYATRPPTSGDIFINMSDTIPSSPESSASETTAVISTTASDTSYYPDRPVPDHEATAIPSGTTALGDFTDLLLMLPSETQHYKRIYTAPTNNEQNWVIQPLEMSYLGSTTASNWSMRVSPEGQPYYYMTVPASRSELENPKYRLVTEENLTDMIVFSEVERLATLIEEEIENTQREFPSQFDVVLEHLNNMEFWSYYMVDHDNLSIFWLDEYNATSISKDADGLPSKRHLKQYFHYEYWYFMEQFPALSITHIAEKATVNELLGIILHGSIDLLSSTKSTMLFDRIDCQELLNTILIVKDKNLYNDYTACSISRLMGMIAKSRFLNYYGQHGSRLSLDQSIHGPKEEFRTLVITLISPLLFFAPNAHLRKLESIWIDKTIVEQSWKLFTTNLREEWEDLITSATIVMTANVAFLAIPNFDPNNVSALSIYQVPSLLSTIASLGSILMGLILVRQHRTKAKETASEAARYLLKWTHRTLGLEILAILYSLPYAALMWSVVFFVISISLMCFKASSWHLQLLFALAWSIVATMVFWAIYAGWDVSALKLRPFVAWIKHCVDILMSMRAR